MVSPRIDRRLAAILAADVVGYSRLMERDETGTLSRLKAHRKEFVEPLVAEQGGRIVKLMGDGLLCEFASAVDAVQCAVLLQNGMAEREAGVPEAERIRLRIGINLGDVIHEEGDVYGDGVNIAARLQALAEPDGIHIARNIHSQVKGKLAFRFEPAGRHTLKNIAEPVEVWRVGPGDGTHPRPAPARRPRLAPAVAAGIVLLLVGGGAWWWHAGQTSVTSSAVASGLPLPDKPSIAVLPFTNMSGDPTQDYFSDGISEDIITALSRFDDLFVIARNSSFVYKGKVADVRDIGHQLGVQYVLEGSVQRSGEQIRINAQLIDALANGHLWAERYDRPAADLFAIQDEITQRVTTALGSRHGAIPRAELARTARMDAKQLQAHDLLLQGIAAIDRFTRDDVARGQDLLHRAIELDPSNAHAFAKLAIAHWLEFTMGWSSDPEATLKELERLARQALDVDPSDPWAHWALGYWHLTARRLNEALAEQEKAHAILPNDADLLSELGWMRSLAGDPERGLVEMRAAMRLSPYCPNWYVSNLAQGLYMLGQYEEVIRSLTDLQPQNLLTRLYLAASYAELDRLEEARAQMAEALRLDPALTIEKAGARRPFKREEDRAHYLDGLRKAGLPS
ncbi:adenylate/guanylate cyclase domain-containing protein [Benzoatithermus flavus]|uniref:Adenylate/guanylate cyclase domain-containing protein n=1 Tax=Benzoatithermus flavus TaxID=3108223 RepID=A0ABU8XY48_9PROT